MSQPIDQNPTTTPPATPPAGQEPPTGTATPPADHKTPEWYEAELGKTRNEAANYRTKLRDAEAKLTAAKTVEEFEAATNELKATIAKQERDLLVAKVGKDLPDELAALLKGDTEAELLAHAEVLKKFVQPQAAPPEQLGGGLNPGQGVDDFDPVAIARKARQGRL